MFHQNMNRIMVSMVEMEEGVQQRVKIKMMMLSKIKLRQEVCCLETLQSLDIIP